MLVVGCARSGTTLLQSALAAHPSVFSSPETHFFIDTVGQRGERLFALPPSTPGETIRRLLHRARVRLGIAHPRACRHRLASFVTDAGRADLVKYVPRYPLSIDSAARRYVELGDRIAREYGKSVWLEKTPGHLHYLETIERYVPDLKVVCIVRSAQDTIASMYDVANRYPDRWLAPYRTVEGCVARWLASARAAYRQAGVPNRMFVAYEKLVAEPAPALVAVCEFAGINYHPQMLAERRGVYRAIVRDREPHKRNVQEQIRSRNGTKFQELFDERQRASILAALGDWPERMQALCEGRLQAETPLQPSAARMASA
ncbi:sulfotransferase [Fulvimonas yonginensis]|uniref:Sulfotransferase n=1 Tax=Fulvimonas yonginensis TaxID=1495200 RepID=A0ABU8J891_9GAMM